MSEPAAPDLPSWHPAPRHPAIGSAEVQVWRTEVPGSARMLAAAAARLPAAERERAAAMRNPGAQGRYVVGRALVQAVRARLPAAPGLGLSLSHSASLALLAVGRGRRVGVDVERLRPHLDPVGVARLALSSAEAESVAAEPDPESARAAFFACWTRKEAYLKARGEGLPGRLRHWSVVPAGRGLFMPLLAGDPALSRRWRIRSLVPGDGYAGAVAHEGEARLRCYRLEWEAARWGAAELADSHYFDAERRLHLLL